MHCAAAQATVHKTINEGHPERGTAYSVLMNKDKSDQNCEELLKKLHKEADKALVDTNNMVFIHQLYYDARLAGFIISTEKNLQEKCDEVWDHTQWLADTAGVPQDVHLGIALQILDLPPLIPIDLSFLTPIPMMLGYAPETYVCWT